MSNRKAYTLIELVMVIVITGIVSGIAAMVISNGIDAWVFLNGQGGMLADARGAMKRMVGDIRNTENAQDGILTFTATDLRFRDVSGNIIEYRQNGTNLESSGLVLLTGLTSPDGLNFVYLDKDGAAASYAEDIRSVQVTLITQGAGNRVRLRSAAAIRNR